jgi:DNA-binding winged helix-turn-helix (wHTH) protein
LAIALGPLVALDGVPLDLPRVQIRLLRKLMEASQPVSVGELASGVWPGELVATHTVHTQIALLRDRLESFGIKIDHIRRAGYVLSLLQRKEA